MSAAEILGRIESQYGRPAPEDLSGYFTTPFIEVGIAERIARSFELWWDGRFDESAHVIVPRIEAVIRNVARDVGLPIIREPYGVRARR